MSVNKYATIDFGETIVHYTPAKGLTETAKPQSEWSIFTLIYKIYRHFFQSDASLSHVVEGMTLTAARVDLKEAAAYYRYVSTFKNIVIGKHNWQLGQCGKKIETLSLDAALDALANRICIEGSPRDVQALLTYIPNEKARSGALSSLNSRPITMTDYSEFHRIADQWTGSKYSDLHGHCYEASNQHWAAENVFKKEVETALAAVPLSFEALFSLFDEAVANKFEKSACKIYYRVYEKRFNEKRFNSSAESEDFEHSSAFLKKGLRVVGQIALENDETAKACLFEGGSYSSDAIDKICDYLLLHYNPKSYSYIPFHWQQHSLTVEEQLDLYDLLIGYVQKVKSKPLMATLYDDVMSNACIMPKVPRALQDASVEQKEAMRKRLYSTLTLSSWQDSDRSFGLEAFYKSSQTSVAQSYRTPTEAALAAYVATNRIEMKPLVLPDILIVADQQGITPLLPLMLLWREYVTKSWRWYLNGSACSDRDQGGLRTVENLSKIIESAVTFGMPEIADNICARMLESLNQEFASSSSSRPSAISPCQKTIIEKYGKYLTTYNGPFLPNEVRPFIIQHCPNLKVRTSIL